MPLSGDRDLPKPGRAVLRVLTPGGVRSAEWSTTLGPTTEGRAKLFAEFGERAELVGRHLAEEKEEEPKN
jgi:hypothetical protein